MQLATLKCTKKLHHFNEVYQFILTRARAQGASIIILFGHVSKNVFRLPIFISSIYLTYIYPKG